MRKTAKPASGVAFADVETSGVDHSIGTWKLNVEKSKTTPASTNPIMDLTAEYEAIHGGAMVAANGQRKDGTAIHIRSTVRYDGKKYLISGAPYDTISARQMDANTVTFEDTLAGGKYHTTGRQVISQDGKTMTITCAGIDAEGKPISGTQIYDRQ